MWSRRCVSGQRLRATKLRGGGAGREGGAGARKHVLQRSDSDARRAQHGRGRGRVAAGGWCWERVDCCGGLWLWGVARRAQQRQCKHRGSSAAAAAAVLQTDRGTKPRGKQQRARAEDARNRLRAQATAVAACTLLGGRWPWVLLALGALPGSQALIRCRRRLRLGVLLVLLTPPSTAHTATELLSRYTYIYTHVAAAARQSSLFCPTPFTISQSQPPRPLQLCPALSRLARLAPRVPGHVMLLA